MLNFYLLISRSVYCRTPVHDAVILSLTFLRLDRFTQSRFVYSGHRKEEGQKVRDYTLRFSYLYLCCTQVFMHVHTYILEKTQI